MTLQRIYSDKKIELEYSEDEDDDVTLSDPLILRKKIIINKRSG